MATKPFLSCKEVDDQDVDWWKEGVVFKDFVLDVLLRFEKLKRDKALRYAFADKSTADRFQHNLTSSHIARARLGSGVFKTRKHHEGKEWVLYVRPGPKYNRMIHNKEFLADEQWGKGFDEVLRNRAAGRPNTGGPKKAET